MMLFVCLLLFYGRITEAILMKLYNFVEYLIKYDIG